MNISEARRLEYDAPMPKMMHGMHKMCEEVFINSYGYPTEHEALEVLEKIRDNHSQKYGWFCLGGIHEGVCKDLDGNYHAYRHHAQYRE